MNKNTTIDNIYKTIEDIKAENEGRHGSKEQLWIEEHLSDESLRDIVPSLSIIALHILSSLESDDKTGIELSEQLHVNVNGTRISLPKTAFVNGKTENEFYRIRENDDIQVRNCYTVREIAGFMDVPLGGKILVNDVPAKPDTAVYENFTLEWDVNAVLTYADLEDETEEELEKRRAAKEAAAAAAAAEAEKNFIEAVNHISGIPDPVEEVSAEASGRTVQDTAGTPYTAGAAGRQGSANVSGTAGWQGSVTTSGTGRPDSGMTVGAGGGQAANDFRDTLKVIQEENTAGGIRTVTVYVNKHPVVMTGKESYVFVDVFSFYDFDLNASAGRAIVTNINGRRAEYMEPLTNGDIIDIYWEKV